MPSNFSFDVIYILHMIRGTRAGKLKYYVNVGKKK